MQNWGFRTTAGIYTFTEQALPDETPQREVGHHIFVIDRSGSMYGDIEALKKSVEQVITAASMSENGALTSLISFSSHGDVTLHWSRVSADFVSALDTPYVNELRRIRATAYTGISQGLDLALAQVVPGQTTGITLFTDGYANDPSPSAEIKALNAFTAKVRADYTRVFLNVVGYRDWCDWPLMTSMANDLSGRCVKATSFKDVYAVMNDTQQLLSNALRPARAFEARANGAWLVVNRSTGQVNTSRVNESLTLQGVRVEDKLSVFFVSLTASVPSHVKMMPKEERWLAGAWALGLSLQRELRAAKTVLFATGNKTLWEDHQAALTPSTLAAMNTALGAWVAAGTNDAYTIGLNTIPPHDLFELANVLNSLPAKSLGLDTQAFMQGYRRRSIKRIAGTRQEDGSITPPNAELTNRSGSVSRTYIKGVSFNRADASMQLETERAVWVKRLSDGAVFDEVDYISLDKLRDYASYTLISCGERNVEVLPVQVYTKEAMQALAPFVTKAQTRVFTAGKTININLARFRVESSYRPELDELLDNVNQLFTKTAEVKVLSAAQDKAEASPYTPEQVEALKALHLTPALYFSGPTTTHYADRDEAVQTGMIDSFTRNKVNFGFVDMLDLSDFRSGNAFLDRRYTVTLDGAVVKKPKLDTYLQGATYEVKPPGKAKDTRADQLMARFADSLLLGPRRYHAYINHQLDLAKGAVEASAERLQPLVMEIGCTGLLPPELEKHATSYDADAFAQHFDIKLSKDQKEGMFFVFTNSLVISIVPETSWYTVRVS